MDKYKISPKVIVGVLIAIFFGISLLFRVSLPYDQVFSGEWIKFTSIDAYYYMHLVDNLSFNFPDITSIDLFRIYPGVSTVGSIRFFAWFLASVIWVIGLGSPTQHVVDVVGVYFPAILAALTIIPVYFIGKTLFNRWVGVLAAFLIAVLPGEYMGRSILGFTDHHVAETLFSTTAILFLILAIKTAGQRQMTYGHLIRRDWAIVTRPLVFSLLGGIFLGIYLITWAGAPIFVFIITLYFIIQFVIDHLRRQSSEHLGVISFVLFLVPLIIYLPFAVGKDTTVSLVVAMLVPLALSGVSLLLSSRGLKPFYYPLTLVGMAVVLLVIFDAIAPDVLSTMLDKFRFVFFPVGASATTTLEMQPFLSPQGSFSTAVAWGNYTTSFFLFPSWPIPGFAFISLIILIWLFIKQRSNEKHRLLFFIWTLIILLATLMQRRFAYYLVINISLLSAYLSWQAIWLAGLRKFVNKPENRAEGVKAETARDKTKKRHGITMNHINVILSIIVVFFFVLFPNIVKAKEVASAARFAPSDAWQASLTWMKENTPEPFGDPDAYYKIYERTSPGETFEYPESAYGVTAWWDYGYWITRIAHRLPSANPAQEPGPITKVARLFLSQDESLSDEVIEELDSSYLIADYATATSKFWAVVTWAGQKQSDFVGVYYLPYEGELMPVQFFYPEYYHTLFVRLYNFDGKAVTDTSSVVISYEEKVDDNGNRYKQISNFEEFSSYQEALDYIERQESGNHEIVGINPFISPIPLEAVQNFKLIYSSESGVSYQNIGIIPEVKIFEYISQQ